MLIAFVKTLITIYLVYAFIELFLEIREIIEDKEYQVTHCPEWYMLPYVAFNTCIVILLYVIVYMWF